MPTSVSSLTCHESVSEDTDAGRVEIHPTNLSLQNTSTGIHNFYFKNKSVITQEKIQEIVQKIVEGYQPERIILFGSYANGTPTEDSDLDLLIVKEVEEPKFKRSSEVRKLLRGSNVAMDILVYTPAELNKWKDLPVAFEHHILQTGKVLYASYHG